MSESKPIHVLYMEDDAGLARLLQKRLERAGYVVTLARDGAEGLARTENHKWVGAFLDGPFIAAVFDAPEPEWARRLIASLRLPKK